MALDSRKTLKNIFDICIHYFRVIFFTISRSFHNGWFEKFSNIVQTYAL